MLAMLMVLIAGCSQDPCAYGEGLPSCDASRAVAKQTIAVSDATRAAVEAASAMKATQNAVSLKVQATQGAINSQATALAVQQSATRGAREQAAEGTKQAIGLEATRSTLMMSATQSALVLQATSQSITADATKTALDGETRIQRSAIDLAAAGWQQMIVVTVVTAAFVLLVGGGLWYIRRFAQIGMHGFAVKTSIVRFGPQNSHWALVSPGRDGNMNILLTDAMVGPYASSDGLLSTLQQLQLPPNVIIQVLADQMKRSQLVLAAQAAGQLPGAIQQVVNQPNSSAADLPAAGQNDSVRIPAMSELLQTWRPSRRQMLLGIDRNGQPHYCALEDLLSTGVIGRPKTGKTTLLRFIYLQCRLLSAHVLVWDLHLTLTGDLPGSNAYTELQEINHSAEQMCLTLDHRITHKEYDAQPIMIMVDEFNLLAPNSAQVTEAIGRIILEGRKVNMFAMISGQGLPATLFGGSTARDALSSRFVLHTTTRQAQMVGLDREFLPWVINLKPGMAVVDGPIDPTVLAIPNTTASDLALLPNTRSVSRAASMLISDPLPTDVRSTSWEAENKPETDTGESAEADKSIVVRELLRQGKSQREIISEIWGATGGRAYQRASEELRHLIQEMVS